MVGRLVTWAACGRFLAPTGVVSAVAGAIGLSYGSDLHLSFFTEVEGRPLIADSLRYEGSRSELFSITRLDWIASGFSVATAGGELIELPEVVAFVSLRGAALTLPDLPDDKLTAITFHVGPDKEANHSNPAKYTANHPLNPNYNRLHWDWQGGYIFMAVEGHWRSRGQKLPGGFAYHFANDWNRTRVTLPVDLDLSDEARVAIALDAGDVLAGLSFAEDGATTHSVKGDPVADQLKQNLGRSLRIARIEKGGLPAEPEPPKPIDLPSSPRGHPIRLPKHVPLPSLPSDNPILESRVALGKALFHDPKLSRTNAISCASCHQGPAMSDPRRFSPGVDDRHGNRHSMPLFNLAWKDSFFWDGRAPSLREQALVPIEDHLEMDESLENVVSKLKTDPAYPQLFAAAFGSGEISGESIGLALENFLLTRLSLDSKIDQVMKGRATLTDREQRGFELFFTESEPRLGKLGADCFHCHGGALFTDHSFHNNGLAVTDDLGLEAVTGNSSDRYKFSTPSLRNVALTAPYMHDGRFATLEEVVDHYNSGFERNETLDPNLAKHPGGLNLSEADKRALVAFLKTLTDPAMIQSGE